MDGRGDDDYHRENDPTGAFLSTPEYQEAPLSDQINVCRAWLQRNSNSTNSVAMQMLLLSLEQQLQKDQQLQAMALGSVRARYPVLHDRTLSKPYSPKNHGSAQVVEVGRGEEGEENVVEHYRQSIKELTGDDDFWKAGLWPSPPEADINCDSESCALSRVVAVVMSVLLGMKLNDVVEVVTNRTLAGVECNLLLIYKPNRLPFLCIEVKKPGNTPQDQHAVFHGDISNGQNLVAGELYDECKAIELFGFDKHGGVVGMVSTGNHWHLTCTRSFPNTPDDLVRGLKTLVSTSQEWREDFLDNNDKDKENAVGISLEQSKVAFNDDEEKSETTDDDDNDDDDDEQTNRRTLYASRVVPDLQHDKSGVNVAQAGEQIVQLVVLYMFQACSTLVGLLNSNNQPTMNIVLRPKMPCRFLTNNECVFSFGTVKLLRLVNEKFLRGGEKLNRYMSSILSAVANSETAAWVSPQAGPRAVRSNFFA